MNTVLEKYFIDTYPKIFGDMYKTNTCMAFGIECKDGWFFLLDTLCRSIQTYIDARVILIEKGYAEHDESKLIPQVVARQIKEKFGALRFYYDGGDSTVENMVDITEQMSYYTCEECGRHDQTVGRTFKGWIRPLCAKCAIDCGAEIKHRTEIWELFGKAKNADPF
jgi:hypothetical protein